MPSKDTDTGTGKGGSIVVETMTRLMVPFIQLFALYVIIHGAGGPGGGFQGGVIFASSFVLYVIAFGIVKAGNRFSERANIVLFSTGVYLYAGVGLLCILFSYGAAQFLNYGYIPLTHHFEENRALGMDLVEVGIGITVMAVITSIFFNLVWKREEVGEREGED
ncbi:MAG: MnhB domain-containing protein [Methanosarcinales archaeon]